MIFELSPEQHTKINKWADEHECPISYEGAIGGKITYQFTPNSIGMTENVVCACGEKLDVTDYDMW